VSVIAANSLDAVVEASRERTEKEEKMFSRLQAGETTVEILELDGSVIKVEGS
jgi:regulator of RNase E activity RraA